MNVLLAWALMAVVLSRGAEVPLYETSAPIVGSFSAGSSAQAGGMHVGDRIVRIAGRNVATWNDLMEAVGQKPNQDLPVDVKRGEQTMTLHLTPRSVTYRKFEVGDLGVLPILRPLLDQITPGGAAAKAGLQAGDVVIAVNGQHGLDREAIVKQLQGSAGKPIVFTVERAGEDLDVSVTPVERGGVGVIGVALVPYEVRRIAPGWRHASGLSLQENWDRAAMIGRTLRGLVTAQTPINQLMGPVAIAQQSGEFAALGWISLLDFMAMISLNLGLINLMPVPVMDGGQIAILALEGVSRREMSSRLKEKILLAGAALVVLLMVTVIYNDVMRLVR
jgi:regulator of sigma E protease